MKTPLLNTRRKYPSRKTAVVGTLIMGHRPAHSALLDVKMGSAFLAIQIPLLIAWVCLVKTNRTSRSAHMVSGTVVFTGHVVELWITHV